jgi:hypothetical protein
MASLTSPGVSVSIIDQSQYVSTQAGSVPFVLLATAQDKLTPSGTLAAGTTIANADKLITVTSQRDLVTLFGSPNFAVDASGNPVNASEQSEYGLLAAYSALGVTNTMYVLRANVDLAQLTGTSSRPTGKAADGTYWLDVSTSGTNFGIFEYNYSAAQNEAAFTAITPSVITSTSYLTNGVPLSTYGAVGDYAVVATSSSNPIYYKGYNNTWALVGSPSWQAQVPTVTGTAVNPSLSAGTKMVINGTNVSLTGTTVTSAASVINGLAITGVTATAIGGQLLIFASNTAASSGNIALPDGKIAIKPGTVIGGTDCAANIGLLQASLSVVSANTYTYNGPTITYSSSTGNPAWLPTDTPNTRPSGSIWLKTSAQGNGASYGIKEYNATLNQWTPLAAPLYANDNAAIYALDATGGGAGIQAGSIYVQYDTLGTNTLTAKPYIKNTSGVVTVTGTVLGASGSYHQNDSFILSVSVPGSGTTQSATVTLSANTAASMVSGILAANLPNITAGFNASGAIFISHLAGGTIQVQELVGTPLVTAGILPYNIFPSGITQIGHVRQLVASSTFLITPFTPLTYFYSTVAPYSNPTNGTLWYYSSPLDIDMMINDGTGWKGYHNVTNDARGYNLSATDANGVILAASQPTTQSDGVSQLVAGDLWIDTGELDNFPVIYRYNGATWDLIDNADDVDSNGILFADARWSATGAVNPITDAIPAITSLLTSDYLDSDAPDYRLYARGTLLFNTRRGGYNVKAFTVGALTDVHSVGATFQSATWVTHSGVDPTNNVPYFGHKAQRSVVTRAMKAALASSTALREEQTQFNLITCPGYPELIQDMITLNNDRLDTAFIIGDSPLDLTSDSTSLEAWAKNSALAVDNGEKGLTSHSEYLGVYYPSGFATNLDGNSVVVPASHMMLRTFIRSDAVAYPWFAPAGVRRGLIDNVSSIGYVDRNDNNTFKSIGVTNGLRDVLYANEVNPITILPGVGLVAYGQKTRASMTSAMDRINVARLVCYLRTVLGKVAAPFIFEPNDTITRSQVQSAFNAVFHDLIAKRGIYDYLVVCDETNNTPSRIDANELWVDIAIKPVKAIEFIYIPVRLLNTGAALAIQ